MPARTRKKLTDVSPVARWVQERLSGIGQALFKDPLTTFLLAASIALTVTFFTLVGQIQPDSPGTAVPLSQVEALAKQEQISQAIILDQDSRVVVKTTAGAVHWSAYPKSDIETASLLRVLRRSGAAIAVDQQSGKPVKQLMAQFLIPIVLLVCLFAFFTRVGEGGGSSGFAAFSQFSGKIRRRGAKANRPVTFAQVAGAGDVVAELREIRDYLEDPARYSLLGARAPRGVLLVGPPGTGKTLLARATSGEADAAFFSLSGAEFVESLVGVGAARVRDLFKKARKHAPSIVFIDEIDAAGRRRGAGVGQGNDEREQTLNQLLVEMDGFDNDAGVVVMAATNRPDILDPALLRPGRFDRQITVDVPDVHGRAEILALHCSKRPIAPDVTLEQIARLTPGFSGAELANVANEAALLAVRGDQPEITQEIFEEAVDRVVAGPASRSHHVLTRDELWVIAVHEAAHAVAAKSIGQTTGIQKLSIVARGRQLGTAASMLTDKDQILLQEPDLRRQLIATMAGAAGEQIAFGCFSTGVAADLSHATNLARSMVASFGMSPELGSLSVGEQSGEVFLGAALQDLGSTAPETLNVIDRETRRFLDEASVAADRVLRRNWAAVEETASALLDHETLSGHALEAVLTTVVSSPLEDPDDFLVRDTQTPSV